MATSRTGTTQWLNVSRKVLKDAQAQGITHCPSCHVELNYKDRRSFNGAWVDHIIPHAKGGTDDPSNLTVLCRTCNISKSDGTKPKPKTVTANQPLRTSRRW